MMHPIDITGKAVGIKQDSSSLEHKPRIERPSSSSTATQSQNAAAATSAAAGATAGTPREKMGSLERVLEQDVAKKGSRRKNESLADAEDDEVDFAPEPEDEKYLEPSALTVQDAVYDEDADDDLADLGFQMGKMRLTDRVGGFFRPKMAEEYWQAVHPIARAVHRHSFQRRYDIFWNDVSMGVEPPNSLQAVVFAAMFSGIVSMHEDAILMGFGVSKKDLVENFQMGTETALGRANFIRTAKLETLQAFIMYMIPLCRGEVSRAHSALVGTAVRIAECMGLHRDGTEYGLGPIETHVRRILWYQLCLLDIRTCEAQGPRPVIRAEDFDTQFPSNIDDVYLEQGRSPRDTPPRWTDMTMTLIRMECNEIIRVVWVDRPRLEKKKISLTAVLGKVENFRRTMKEKYMSLIDDSVPLQHAGRLIFEIQSLRMHAMILHRYHNSVAYSIPGKSKAQPLSETLAEKYRSTASNYHYLGSDGHGMRNRIRNVPESKYVVVIYAFPMRKEADRIWACLDYIFDVPRNLPREHKGRWIITQVRDKTGYYMGVRKARAPAKIDSFSQQAQRSASSSASPVNIAQQSGGNAQPQQSDLMPAGLSRQVSYSQPANAPYPSRHNPPAPSQVPLGPAGHPNMPPVSNAPMVDIDWYEWDKLFPPDVNTGELNLPNVTG
ncbi:MAG: hypothetical protein Q9195_000192 [Heterodermia aff. obscurata]